MTVRLDRARRLARTAQQAEDVAGARLLASNNLLHAAEESYRVVLEQSGTLLTSSMGPALRSLLITSGAKAQAAASAERDRLRDLADDDRRRWEDARVRTRSMDKLVERAVAKRTARRIAVERAELGDVIAGRLAAGLS